MCVLSSYIICLAGGFFFLPDPVVVFNRIFRGTLENWFISQSKKCIVKKLNLLLFTGVFAPLHKFAFLLFWNIFGFSWNQSSNARKLSNLKNIFLSMSITFNFFLWVLLSLFLSISSNHSRCCLPLFFLAFTSTEIQHFVCNLSQFISKSTKMMLWICPFGSSKGGGRKIILCYLYYITLPL